MIGQADIETVSEAIRAAETRTAGEIFCVITQSSGSYRLVPLAWAALAALVLPLPLIYVTTWPALIIYVGQLALFVVTAAVLSLPGVRYYVVPRRVMHQHAHDEAMRQFLAHGLHLTEARTGVLIFASVAERYAEIIADSGIHSKVGTAAWQEAVATMVAAIKADRPAQGFIAAIEKCGAVLAQHFPPGAINRNELPNALVVM
ncbi:MAG: TPM domain-containing protein [Xanthobacteraceae bacterium]